MGKRNAVSVALNLQVSFPGVNLALLVGICGAVPFPSEDTEVILGDVVISDKVVEYDFGRQFPDGFRRKRAAQETLGGPNRTIRSFLSGMKTSRMRDQLQGDLWKNQQTLKNQQDGKWRYPGTAQDQLFEATYRHKHYHQHPETTCLCAECHYSSDPVCEKALDVDCRKTGCMGSPVPRTRLIAELPKPQVHFGSMASADTVMKSGQHRDEVAALEKVTGFEMEGAGIWDILPCVIIKGVCDYADSHKNKTWQNYAAATAASCTKAFLKYWTSSISDLAGTFPVARVPGKDNTYEETLSDDQRKELLDLLRFDQIDVRQMSLKPAQGKTCRWMLQNPKYKDWLDHGKLQNHNGFLWIKGKPGAGKSIMMKFLYQQARKSMKSAVVISFFFNARGEALEKSTMGLYRSLLHHLLCKMPDLMPCLDCCATQLSAIKNRGWQPEMLKEIFALVVDHLRDRRVVCFVDALDECPEDDVRDMISLFEELSDRENSCNFLVCFSSRHYPEITIKTGLQLVLEKEQNHGDDIRLYIDSQLKIESTPQADDIKAEILRKSSNIFLWVALVIPMLNKAHDRGRTKALKRRLNEIPADLHDLFVDILTRDCNNVDEMVLCIQFILFAKRPLSPQELHVALSTGFDDQVQDPFNAAEVTAEVLRKFVLDVSKGLAEITKSKVPTVQFIHESVRDFLLKEGGINKLRTSEKNIEGQSHARITGICLLQLSANLNSYDYSRLMIFPIAFLFSLTEEISRNYPFLEYAVNHILHHSNAAQRLGVSQLSFFERLNQTRWIAIYNAFQKYSHYMYEYKTHILYVLSAQGMEALIRVHPERAQHLSLRGGLFRYPIVAALYSGQRNAARALVGIDPSEDFHPDSTPQSSLDPPRKMRLEGFKPSRGLITFLSEFGDADILRKVLEDGEYKRYEYSKYLPGEVNPLHYASSEAVVELLIEFLQDFGLILTGPHPNNASTNTNIAVREKSSNSLLSPQMIEHWPLWTEQTLLQYAAERGFERLAKVAIQQASYAVDQTNSRGQTPFSLAAQGRINHSGRLTVMKYLHEAHANPNMPDEDDNTPLHHAVITPFNDKIIQFLSSTSEVNLENKDHKEHTALASAVLENQLGYTQILLAAGANPMSLLGDSSTMLIYTVKQGNMRMFNLLFGNSRCEHDAVDRNGRTALSWCATVGDEVAATMMSMLLQSETVNPNLRDAEGRTALERAICGAQPAMVRMLCMSTMSLDLTNGKGGNLLGLVVALCREQNCPQFQEIARILLTSGHFKPRWGRGHRYPLLERCESYGLREISQMIRTFLEGGNLGPPRMEYQVPIFITYQMRREV